MIVVAGAARAAAVRTMAEIASNDALELLKADGQRVGRFLQEVLAGRASAPPRLLEAIDYSVMAGGKRLRPALVLECARACSAGEGNENRSGSYFPSSGAAEENRSGSYLFSSAL